MTTLTRRSIGQVFAVTALLAVLAAGSVFAQSSTPNLALQTNGCTATHISGGSTTAGYGPELYNDGNIPLLDATGTYLWGWFTSGVGNWMQFDWGTVPRTFDEITLYFAQSNTRQLQGGQIQIWNGTAWVVHHTFPDLGIIASGIRVITFPPVTTTMVRVVYLSGGSNPNFREVEIRYSITAPNDAGIASIDSPLNFCAGTYPVIVTLQNFGTNRITSATLNWTLNGVAQAPLPWSGLLDTLNATTRRTQVTLHPGMTFAPATPYTIRVWTSSPNGVSDPNTANDSLTVTRQAALAGTFTVGGTSPNYPTLTAAVNDLVANGVCGPVRLVMRSGIYPEQVTVKQMAGVSATNTVTIESETGVNTDVILRGAGTSTVMHTLLLDGADWLRVQNITIEGTNTTYARVVTLQSNALNNVFLNNRIVGPVTTSSTTNMTNLYMSGSGSDNNTFENNQFLNGSYSMYYYGGSSTSLVNGTKFKYNVFRDFVTYGFYLWYQNAPEVIGNTVSVTNTSTNYMMYLGYCQNQVKVIGNRINCLGTSGTKYGLYVYYCTATIGGEGTIANNMVTMFGGASTIYGLYAYYSNNQNFDFNTVHTTSTSTASRTMSSYYGSNHRFTNNLFTGTGSGYAYYYYYTTGYRQMDYNVYATTGVNLGYWDGTNHTTLAQLQAITLKEANSLVKSITYRDIPTGDLHLAGASQNDVTLTGQLWPEITTDIDGDPRILPYRGADEACYILPNTVTARFVDGGGQPMDWFEIPGTIQVNYTVAFPNAAMNVGITVNLYTVPGNQLAFSYQFNVSKLAGQTLTGTTAVPVPSTLGTGYYRAEIVFNTMNSCGDYINYTGGSSAVLGVPQGQSPCIVWPGDVNNDGIVNYGDRSALNKYIFNANLRPSWLNGPARYRPDAATNPMTYYTWEGQPAAPWQTPEGCYMDCDGNGVVNTYDLLVARVNWMRSHGSWEPKSGAPAVEEGFALMQNYPNPFNPSTTVQYAVPEESRVTLTVLDAAGRTLAVLVDAVRAAGVHTQQFAPEATVSGGVLYLRMQATGLASGLSYEQTRPMLLAK